MYVYIYIYICIYICIGVYFSYSGKASSRVGGGRQQRPEASQEASRRSSAVDPGSYPYTRCVFNRQTTLMQSYSWCMDADFDVR